VQDLAEQAVRTLNLSSVSQALPGQYFQDGENSYTAGTEAAVGPEEVIPDTAGSSNGVRLSGRKRLTTVEEGPTWGRAAVAGGARVHQLHPTAAANQIKQQWDDGSMETPLQQRPAGTRQWGDESSSTTPFYTPRRPEM
jgi:hypothetical protein